MGPPDLLQVREAVRADPADAEIRGHDDDEPREARRRRTPTEWLDGNSSPVLEAVRIMETRDQTRTLLAHLEAVRADPADAGIRGHSDDEPCEARRRRTPPMAEARARASKGEPFLFEVPQDLPLEALSGANRSITDRCAYEGVGEDLLGIAQPMPCCWVSLDKGDRTRPQYRSRLNQERRRRSTIDVTFIPMDTELHSSGTPPARSLAATCMGGHGHGLVPNRDPGQGRHPARYEVAAIGADYGYLKGNARGALDRLTTEVFDRAAGLSFDGKLGAAARAGEWRYMVDLGVLRRRPRSPRMIILRRTTPQPRRRPSRRSAPT